MYCSSCGWKNEDQARFCQKCGISIRWVVQDKTASLAEVPSSVIHAGGPGAYSQPNWFQRHLNWTLVITWLVNSFAAFVLAGLIGYYIEEEYYAGLAWTLIIGIWVVEAIVGGWVLKQKGRSLWWLLLTPLWIGVIAWLALDNRRQAFPSRTASEAVAVPTASKKGTENRPFAAIALMGGVVALIAGVVPWVSWTGFMSTATEYLMADELIEIGGAYGTLAAVGGVLSCIIAVISLAEPRLRVFWASLVAAGALTTAGAAWGFCGIFMTVKESFPAWRSISYENGLYLSLAGGIVVLLSGLAGLVGLGRVFSDSDNVEEAESMKDSEWEGE